MEKTICVENGFLIFPRFTKMIYKLSGRTLQNRLLKFVKSAVSRNKSDFIAFSFLLTFSCFLMKVKSV